MPLEVKQQQQKNGLQSAGGGSVCSVMSNQKPLRQSRNRF